MELNFVGSNHRSLAHVVRVHSEAGALQLVAKLAGILPRHLQRGHAAFKAERYLC